MPGDGKPAATCMLSHVFCLAHIFNKYTQPRHADPPIYMKAYKQEYRRHSITCMYVCMYVSNYVYTSCTCICMYISIYAHTHTHTHTHTVLLCSYISCAHIFFTEAYVSLVTNDNYAVGALVLGQSLRDSLTQRNLSLLITNDVSHAMR